MDDILTSLATYGYIILAWYSFGGGMLGLIGAGILSSMGKMDIALSIAIATISNFIGDNVLFYLARTNKKEALKYFKKHKRKIAWTNLLMRKYGWLTVFLQKYVYGVKTLVPIIMGMSRYDIKKFILLNIPASILWGLVVGLISFYFSGAVRSWVG